ncbi:TonB-dependent receptor [Galbibacter sp. EGI 63066]|uniref:TonB-dependent receptor n=1 Tax=Galbibacter sp. EGI 63066 TaxID=2993559 RepID=UPI002248F368|nr:TonB-dependent receptor [Galbibacter sp. EGI 63066]MCX2681250.1 TonB-dependent receptor [Galbibacter sp. EGI 63066]
MKKYISGIILLFVCSISIAQNTFEATIKDQETKEPLVGVSVYFPSLEKGGSTDVDGHISIPDIPNGKHNIELSYIGYEALRLERAFPLSEKKQILYMTPVHEEMEEVVITSTRSSRTIEDIPTRVEFIAGEELAEKGNMKPGDIRMLLNESTGIQTQQTSATSYNSSIRIQGLDGKYTLLLRDGLPLYSGYSGGLSLMQIAPLDLKQVEVVKGASSTLHGGGAIAGLVNLVSKTPEDEPELSFMLNGTSALGLDISGFYAEKYGKVGTTVFASYNKGTPYDPADIGLTAIPEFERFTLNPRFFLYLNQQTEMNFGFQYVTENRKGGNINFIEEKQSTGYFEENKTNRFSTQLDMVHKFSERSQIQFKNSLSMFDRTINIPDYTFAGDQLSSFSEINFSTANDTMEWIAGMNLWTEEFNQAEGSPDQDLSFSNTTFGLFAQNMWNIHEKWTLETGIRGDYQSDYGFFFLPRFSAMFEPTTRLTFRLGGGLGYKTPTIFTEDVERLQFQNVLPIDVNNANPERSTGANFDVNYKWPIGESLTLSTNTLLFYTQIDDPLIMTSNENNNYEFIQPNGHVESKGIEANMKWSYHDFKLFVGYTFADVKQHYAAGITQYPLVSKHRLNNVLMYEKHENFWVGLEAYYFSPQELNNGETGQSYWIMGLMSEKKLGERFSIFLNFENFLDTRQTKFGSIYTGNIDNPEFNDIYAPVDGFVINGGFKLKL